MRLRRKRRESYDSEYRKESRTKKREVRSTERARFRVRYYCDITALLLRAALRFIKSPCQKLLIIRLTNESREITRIHVDIDNDQINVLEGLQSGNRDFFSDLTSYATCCCVGPGLNRRTVDKIRSRVK